MTAEEARREKAKNLRYKKPIVRDLNLSAIRNELDEISYECDEVRYYWESDDDTLLNALDGDEDDAYEFKMAFADLCAECEQMRGDLEDAYVPECFDTLFAAAGAGEYGGGYLGWDSYEQDYFGLDIPEDWIKSEGTKKMERLTKKELIEATGACLKVLYAYLGLHYRYDSLKAAMDILRDENTGLLRTIKAIDELYEKAEKDGFWSWGSEATKQLDDLLNALPQEAWIQ